MKTKTPIIKAGAIVLLVVGAAVTTLMGVAANSHESRIQKLEDERAVLYRMDGKLDLLIHKLIKH